MESDVQDEAGRQKTFTPGEGASAEESFAVNFTQEQKETIRQMVANAESPLEIEEIERSVQRGVLPKMTNKVLTVAAIVDGKGENADVNEEDVDDRKRPPPSPVTILNEKRIKTAQ